MSVSDTNSSTSTSLSAEKKNDTSNKIQKTNPYDSKLVVPVKGKNEVGPLRIQYHGDLHITGVTQNRNVMKSETDLIQTSSTNALYTTTGRVVVTKPLKDMVKTKEFQILTNGRYETRSIVEAVTPGTVDPLTLFIEPDTRVILNYQNKQTRTIDNLSRSGQSIALNLTDVTSFEVHSTRTTDPVEGFDVNCNGVSFSYTDLLIILFLLVIAFYVYKMRSIA